ITVADGAGAQRLQIAPAAGLRQSQRSDRLTGDHPGEPFLLLILSSEGQDVACDHVRVDGELRPCCAGTAELLGDHDVVEEVRSRPAELRRYIGTQKTRVTGFEPQLARHDTD